MKHTIRLYEDNGGGLHMTNGKKIVSGLQYLREPGGLIDNMTTFDEWKNSSDLAQPEVEPVEPGTLIAEYAGGTVTVYTDRLGRAGKRYAGILT